MTATYGSLPFAEAIAFLRDKLDLPAERWTDLWQSAHDRGFMVAGATKADLIADLHAAVLKAREQGTTLAEFRKDFEALVARHGWTGWTGEDTPAGRAWRTRTIYDTNLRTSYQAGRYAQMTDPAVLKWRPYWRYKHSDSVRVPRPHHLAWNGLVLRADDPWWRTHYPPNGWGCKCRVFALSQEDLKKLGKDGPDPTPDDGLYEWTDKQTGEIHLVPKGIDPGWDYAPGASWFPNLDKYPYEVAKELVAANLRDGVFERWHQRIAEQVANELAKPEYDGLNKADNIDHLRAALAHGENYPVAVLPTQLSDLMGVSTQTVLLSDWDLIKQQVSRAGQDFDALTYLDAQSTLDDPRLVVRENDQMTLFLSDAAGHWYAAVLQRTATGQGLFLKSLRRSSLKDARLQRKKGAVLIDELPS